MATTEQAKPVPIPDERSRPFFDGAKAGELRILRCADCGTWMWPTSHIGPVGVHPRCHSCFSPAIEWQAVSGRGTVYSYAIMHQRYPGFEDDVPYNIALVELEQGVRGLTSLVDVANDEIEIGMAVEVTFEDASADVALPKFRPAS
jgi:uncharacterized OB-fold protein